MNISILEGFFYLLLLALISFFLYFFLSLRKAKNKVEREAVEEKFAISVAILFIWYGPYMAIFIVIMILLGIILTKLFH
jgi:uncharacterized membrane protein YsdA (DUF1294 family)